MPDQIGLDFLEWYAMYPRHKQPRDAEKMYRRRRKGGATKEGLFEGARRIRQENIGRDLKFIPYPATWLNAGGDEDEPDKPVKRTINLESIASHVKRPWCEIGAYSREVLEQCVAADLLTRDEMEAKL